MNIHQIDLNKEYDVLCDWWKKRDFDILPKEMLTDFGYMVDDTAAVWLFPIVSSKLCWFGFFVTNPEKSGEERDKALDFLVIQCESIARKMGYEVMMTVSAHPEIRRRLEKHKYILGQDNSGEFFKGI